MTQRNMPQVRTLQASVLAAYQRQAVRLSLQELILLQRQMAAKGPRLMGHLLQEALPWELAC